MKAWTAVLAAAVVIVRIAGRNCRRWKTQLDRAQQHVMIVTAGCPAQLPDHERIQTLACIDNIGMSVMSTFFSVAYCCR